MKLLNYNAPFVAGEAHHHLPGMRLFAKYFAIYGVYVCPIDRTGTISFPVHTKSLYPLPAFRKMPKTYEEICNERAKELLARAETLNVDMYVFWSGGIDSTCVLVSLLKNATAEQKGRIVVLLSEDSISENPNFFREHIHGKLTVKSAILFPFVFGEKHLIINGEHNDQLFGSDIVAKVIEQYGSAYLHQPYDHDKTVAFYDQKVHDLAATRHIVSLFERVREKAPIPIETNYDFFWWVNFTMKWQLVSMCILSFTARRNAHLLSAEYVDSYYTPFFRTDDFQLWSMNNPDKKIKDEWRSYKFTAKDVIYDFTKDADYRDNKLKRGSRHFIMKQQKVWPFLDDTYTLHESLTEQQFYNPRNDFITP